MPTYHSRHGLRNLLVLAAGVATTAMAFAQAAKPPAAAAKATSVKRVTLTAAPVVPPPVKLVPQTTCGKGGKVSVTPC